MEYYIVFISEDVNESMSFAEDAISFLRETQNQQNANGQFQILASNNPSEYYIKNSDKKVKAIGIDLRQVNFFEDILSNAQIILISLNITKERPLNFSGEEYSFFKKEFDNNISQRILIGNIPEKDSNNEINPMISEYKTVLQCNAYYEKQTINSTTNNQIIKPTNNNQTSKSETNNQTTKSKTNNQTTNSEINNQIISLPSILLNHFQSQITAWETNNDDSKYVKVQLLNSLVLLLSKSSFTAQVIESKNAEGDVIVPTFLTHDLKRYTITSIGENAFYDNQKIKSLSFDPDSCVQTIGNFAFQDSSISSLSIPASLVEMGGEWCHKVAHLTEISVDERNPHFKFDKENGLLIKNDKEIAFCVRDKKGLVHIPKNIGRINRWSFYKCNQLMSFINDSSSLNFIDSYAFSECSKLLNFSINKVGKLTLNSYSFASSKSLTSFAIDCNSLEIKEHCFDGCSSISGVNLTHVKNLKIKRLSFLGCNKIGIFSALDLNSLAIENDSFYYVTELKQLAFRSNKFQISPFAFNGCNKIDSIIVKSPNTIALPQNPNIKTENLKSINLESKLDIVLDNSFIYDQMNLESIKLRARKNLIFSNSPFKVHKLLSSVYIECGCDIEISSDTFDECSPLSNFTIAKSKSLIIHENSFCDFPSLKEVNLHGQNVTIENDCFKNCPSLESFKVSGSRKVEVRSNQFENCLNLKTILVSVSHVRSDCILQLADFCFKHATNLSKIKFVGGSINIKKDLFVNAQATPNPLILAKGKQDKCHLTELSIENAINVTIDSGILNNCQELKKLCVSCKKLAIDDNCFNNNPELEEVSFAVQNLSIKSKCFNNCPSLVLKDINADSVSFDSNDFCECQSLPKVKIISKSMIVFGNNCFKENKELQEVKLFASEITLGDQSFGHCSSLRKVDFGMYFARILNLFTFSQTSKPAFIDKIFIGNEAFCKCTDLEWLTIYAKESVDLQNRVFYNLKKLERIEIKIGSNDFKYGDKCFVGCPGASDLLSNPLSFANIDFSAISISNEDLKSEFESCRNLRQNGHIQKHYSRFNSFFVLGVEKDKNEASIISMFPSRPVTFEDFKIDLIPKYCYPKGLNVIDNNVNDSILNGFVFFFENHYGIVLHIAIPDNSNSFVGDKYDRKYPFSLCLISNKSDISCHFTFLSNLVDLIVGKATLSQQEVDIPIELQNRENQNCYQSLMIDDECEFIAVSNHVEPPSFLLPELIKYYVSKTPPRVSRSNNFLYPTLQTFLSCFSPEEIVTLFLFMMCEFKIIFVSNDETKVSFCLLALVNILKSMRTQVTVLPIVPNYEEFVDEIEKSKCCILGFTGVCNNFEVLVNIDHYNKIMVNPSVQVPRFSYGSKMSKKISGLIEKYRNVIKVPAMNSPEHGTFMDSVDRFIYPDCFKFFNQTNFILNPVFINEFINVFERPFIESLGNFISTFFEIETDVSQPVTVFNQDLFLSSIEDEYCDFIQRVTHSKMFLEFKKKLIKKFGNNLNPTTIQFLRNRLSITRVTENIKKQRRMSHSCVKNES